jgi:histidine ammonia-lyase
VPYHARTAAEVAGTSLGMPGSKRAISANSPLAFFVQPDAIFIGNGDLSIDGELLSGSSELENFYGCNITPRSPEALCLLAGTPVFNIDVLELWAVVA